MKRALALAVALVAIAAFWSAIGFPLALGTLIMLLRPTAPSALPFLAALIAVIGFAASFYFLRRWTR